MLISAGPLLAGCRVRAVNVISTRQTCWIQTCLTLTHRKSTTFQHVFTHTALVSTNKLNFPFFQGTVQRDFNSVFCQHGQAWAWIWSASVFEFFRASPHLILNLTFIMQFGRKRFRKLYFSEFFSKFWKAATVSKTISKTYFKIEIGF